MRSVFDFIVKPYNGTYNNKKEINGKELILNTEQQNHNYVNRIGIVLATPEDNQTGVKVGDKVIVHHNVFRRFKDIRGVEKNSKSYYKDDLYFVSVDQLYAYKRTSKWQSCEGYNFVKPIKETKMFSVDFEKPLMGILYTVDETLEDINKGDLIGFKPGSEYEFFIEGEKLYRVQSNSITIKYGHKGDEEEYNPSWTRSGGGINQGG